MVKLFKRILLVITLLSISLPTYASYNKVLILNYSKLDEKSINNLHIDTVNTSVARVENDEKNKKYYLKIIDTFNENDIEISIKYKKKVYIHHYKHIPTYPKNYNISDKIILKRLQKKPLSCELSVTSDILSHLKWINITENDVLDKISKTNLNRLPYTYENKIFWWNPNESFVWYIDYYWEKWEIKPTQRWMTWYWVYEKPIADVIAKYWLKYEIINKDSYINDYTHKQHLTYLLKNLAKWNMIQLWWDWCTREEYDDWTIDKKDITDEKIKNKISAKNYCASTMEDRKLEWYYIEDYKFKKHTGLIGEHAFYLLWYEWGIDNPKKIIVWDSDTGYHKYDTDEWIRKWGLMDYKSIIIYK